MTYIQHLAAELGQPADRVQQAVIEAANKIVKQYLVSGEVPASELTNEQQAGVVAAIRLSDPNFPLHALRPK